MWHAAAANGAMTSGETPTPPPPPSEQTSAHDKPMHEASTWNMTHDRRRSQRLLIGAMS